MRITWLQPPFVWIITQRKCNERKVSKHHLICKKGVPIHMFCILFSTLLFQLDNMKIWKYGNMCTKIERQEHGEEEQRGHKRKPSTWKYIVVVTRLRRLFEHSLDEKMTVIGLFSRNILFILLVIRFVILFDIASSSRSANATLSVDKKLTMTAFHLRKKAEGFPYQRRVISQKSWQFLWINKWKLYYIFVRSAPMNEPLKRNLDT